jgi:hypothetical protein
VPQVDWTPEFKRTTSVEFDKLKLKVGERARIVTLEKPTFTWVHTLRAPKIVDGRANKVIKKRNDGTEYADWDMDFISRPQCLGDHGIIADNGLDAKNCPVCARAKESEEVAGPDRRFAMNIIKYNTKSDGSLVTPFGCASQVWTFTEGIFNKLYDIAQEHSGLVGRDLVLGPCQVPEAYQKFDISAGAKNVWESDERITAIVRETHTQNRFEDLEAACGRKTEARWLKRDVEKIAERWQIAHGKKNGATVGPGTEEQDVKNLKGELDNLINPTAAPEPAKPQLTKPEQAQAESTTTAPAAASEDPMDFAGLLDGLKI